MSTRLQPTALVLITFPLNELSLALYLTLAQQLWSMQVSITAGNEGEKHVEELGIAPESASTVLVVLEELIFIWRLCGLSSQGSLPD